MKAAGILVVIAFLLGSCMGSMTKSADVEFVKIRQPTETVTVEPDPLPAEVIHPESCENALMYAERIAAAASKIYALGDEQLDIISQGRIALGNPASMQTVEEDQRKLHGNTVGALQSMSKAQYLYDLTSEKCEKETE